MRLSLRLVVRGLMLEGRGALRCKRKSTPVDASDHRDLISR